MKKISTILALLSAFATPTVWAEEPTPTEPNAIVVYQTDGKMAVFGFVEKPMITYSNNELVISTTRTSMQFPIPLLRKLSFGTADINTGIEEMEDDVETHFSFKSGTLSIEGGKPYSQVYIFNLSGIKVGQYKLDGDGRADIPTTQLGKDIFLVKTDHFSFKFRKL